MAAQDATVLIQPQQEHEMATGKFLVTVHRQPGEGLPVWSSVGSDYIGPLTEEGVTDELKKIGRSLPIGKAVNVLIIEAELQVVEGARRPSGLPLECG